MAYQTGTVASPTALKTVIESFCTSNGWALSGSDYLYKGTSFVKLTSASAMEMRIIGACSSDGLTKPAVAYRNLYILETAWPVTYYLFLHTAPDMVVCVVQYDTNNIQTLMFGDLVKIHTDAYVGSNFYFASCYGSRIGTLRQLDDTVFSAGTWTNDPGYNASTPILGATGFAYNNNFYDQGLHVEIDGGTWPHSKVNVTDYTVSSIYRSPNTWNSQAHLVPIHLQYAMASSLYGYIGYVEHLRYVRVDNYEIGDIITLGSDKWKVFPWAKKNSTSRNGNGSITSNPDTGTLGFAVRYDGP